MTNMRPTTVPCGSCRACCRGRTAVLLTQEDDPAAFDTMQIPGLPGEFFLRILPNGDCTYLGPQGCTIHERAPMMCRVFDCRRHFLSTTKAERAAGIKAGVFKADVMRRGAILVHLAGKAQAANLRARNRLDAQA